ncbi:MAG TPA: hypothetical protein VK077_02280 [Virgibacillus sp.]|nr:hypothetical protein [Virgibacillus sp.]
MSTKPLQAEEILCINTEKVYDWVVLQSSINNTFTAADLGFTVNPCDPTISNLVTECFITDVNGIPLPLNGEVAVTEVGDRQDRVFVIDGTQVTLQNVSFLKTLYVVVEISGLDGTQPFLDRSQPIPIEIPESLFLCAPEGTDLVVRLTDVECSVRVNCTAGALTNVDVYLNLCQSVQAVTNVTVEVAADFCQPRDIITEQCPPPTIPPQCPILFPGQSE